MEDNDDIKWLYGKLKAKGYDIGSEDEFKSSLANSDDRKWYYDKAKGMGLDMGSMDDFESMYAPKQPAPKQPAAKSAPAAPANEVKPQQPQQSLQPQPKKNEAMTPLQRQAFAASAGRIAARAKAGVAATNERLDNIKQYGIGPNDGETHEGGYKVNPQTNELEQTYITPTGNRYTNMAAADAESQQYRQMTSQALGLDMDDKQVAQAQKPADAAVAALWSEAEKQYASDRDKNANDVYGGNPWLNGGREMRMVNAGLNAHKNKVAQMTRFDLQKMMDSAWERAGKQMTSSLYAQMQKEYPWATDKQLRTSAEKMARQLSDNAVYKYAVAKNTPKSTLEYFTKTAADMNLLGNVAKGLARSEAGTTGDMAAYEAAMDEYGKNHRIAQIGGTVAGMMFDPTTYIGGSVGSFLGKGALNYAGRAYLRNAATGVGARLLGTKLKGRALAGAVGGIGNLGTYEGLKEVESQFLHGGHINAQTGETEGYSAGDVLKSTAHGAILGAATGTVSPLLGNVADKTVKATTSTAGKVGIRAGELAVSTVAEGTIFSVPEWISGNSDAMDVWTDNLSMMLGFKAQHAVKSAPRVIAGLRPIAEPKTMAERNHNRMSFVEKLRKQLDASPRDMAFTKEEREELAKYGYGDLAMLFTRTPKQDNTEAKPADSKVGLPEARAEALHRQWLEDHPEFDGYEAMERLVQDPSVSQAARAKAYYLLTGRLLPMGSITGWTREEDENGNIYVKSVTANGEIVTSRSCKDEASAKAEEDKIKRQAELNSIDVGERYTETQADKEVMKAAIDAVAPGADYETVMRNYQAVKEGDADAKANYGEMMDAIDKFMEQNKDMADGSRPEAIRNNINEEYGVEVDEAIRKEPSKRTEQESKAVQDYIERLFPEQAKERTAQSPEEAEASAMYDSGRQLWGEVEKGDETAKAKMDEVAARLKEANDLCEEAFGADADMRMAEMKEDAWALLNNPELSEAQQDAVLYYINAKAAMDGVTDASNESADNKRQEVENTVRLRTHRDTGMVQPATMKVKNDDGTDKKVYVVKGNLATFDDGTVDVRNSDQSIIICEADATTGENRYRFTSPDQISRVGDGVDPQSEIETASAAIQAEHDAMLGKDAQNSGESVPETAEGEQNPTEMWLHGKLGVKEYLLQVGYFPEWVNAQTDEALLEEANHFARLNPNAKVQRAKYNSHEEELAAEQAGKDVEPNEELTSQAVPGEEKSEEGNESTALSRIPVDEKTGEPMFEQADGETALAAIGELTGGNEANTEAIINAQVEQANKELEALKKKQPKKTAPKLAGSPMAMIKAQQEADANYNAAMEQYNAQLDAAQKKADAWNGMAGLMRDKAAAKLEEEKRIAAEQEAEQSVQTEPGAKVETEPKVEEVVPEAAEPVAAETAKPVEAEPAEDNKPAEAAPKTDKAKSAEKKKKERQKRLNAAREVLKRRGRYYKENAALGAYYDFNDFVMRGIATGRYKFKWGDKSGSQGLGAHLGFGKSGTERNSRIWLLSKDGYTPEEAAEKMLEDYAGEVGYSSIDSIEALGIILDVIREYSSPRKMMDDVIANHAEPKESEDERRMREEYEYNKFVEAYHMTPEEYNEYKDVYLPQYLEEVANIPQEDIDETIVNSEEQKRENVENNGNEKGKADKSSKSVQGERTGEQVGNRSGENTGGKNGSGSRNADEGRPLHEGASRGEAQRNDGGLSKEAGQGADLSEHKAEGVAPLSREERLLRDVEIEHARAAGLDVITDEEGQRVLDLANGKGVRLHAKQKRALETASVSQEEEHQPTAISSAAGAKILKDIDNLIARYEKLSNQTKTFIGDIAVALGIDKKESDNKDKKKQPNNGKSRYATFETVNGKIVTIRLGNHNAKVSNFDNRGEKEGISIVVSPKENNGIIDDGDAHVMEYFYDAIKLRRAEGKPLAEIVKSIKQALYSGEYKDTTGLAEPQDVNAPIQAKGIRFFRTASGEAYGFTVGGKIYIDTRIAGSDTPIHEYAHLWASVLRANNPQEWSNIVELMKGSGIWDEVKERYPELKTDDEIADEVLAHYSGRRGAERLREEARKIAEGNGSIFEKTEAISALERVKSALKAFWKGVCDFLHIHYTSAEEVADRVMHDFLGGMDPRQFGEVDGGLRMSEDEEIKEIIAKAKADGTYMKAPNGKPTNLNERQWAQVRTKAFKKWFGDWENDAEHASKVVDENGEPLVVYHGSVHNFTSFDSNKIGQMSGDNSGFYFTNDKKIAKSFYAHETGTVKGNLLLSLNFLFHKYNPTTFEVFLNARNPYIVGKISNEEYGNREQIVTKAKSGGYDAVVFKGVYDGPAVKQDVRIVFAPNQIKSATDNVGTFDTNNNDIRFQFVGEKGAANAEHAEEVTTRIDNFGVDREIEDEIKEKYKLSDKEKDDATKRIDERIADLHRRSEEDSSHNTVNGNLAEPLSQGKYSPTGVGVQGENPHTAKLPKGFKSSEEIARKLSEFVLNLSERKDVNAENFTKKLVESFQPSTSQESDYVHYIAHSGDRVTIRLSDHNGNARNIIIMGKKSDVGYSFVVRTPNTKTEDVPFRANKWAKVLEFVYKNPNKERLEQIAKGIFDLVDNGEYTDLAGADEIHPIPRRNSETASDEGELFRTSDEIDAEEEATKFRLLDDEDPKARELEALPESELVPVYRNVQAFEDDALGSPMAFTDAVTGERRTLQGQKWNYSVPPEIKLTEEQQKQLDELNKNGYIMVDGKKVTELKLNDALKFVKPKKGDAKLQYFLKKNSEDSGLWADYNPYDHAVETPLNTQFASAYKRPNLVVVRCLIPKSEIDEPYHADYAAKATGAHLWNNGRTLYLSRWSKIDKVLTREEEAKLIDEYWKANPQERDKTSHRDYNRFVPQVRRELEKMGYRFELNGKELTPEESRRLDNQNWENRDIIPGREGNVPFISNEDIARINAKMSGKWVGEPKEAMENAMVERVNELSERLHTPVRIVRTADEVAQLPTVRQRKMKGSFNPRTGEVTIVVPNNANLADIENTFVHEVVGHDGLRVLFPEGETFNNAMDELYRVSADGIKQTIDRNAQKMYDAEVDRIRDRKRKEHEAKGEDASASYYSDMAEAHVEASKKKDKFRRDATEEYGSDLAGRIGEEGFERMSAEEQTFWGKLKAILQKALQRLLEGLKISGRVKFGDKEWAFVLHEAYKRKKNGGRPSVFDVADTVAMRQKTGFGEAALDEGHKKSAHSNEAALKHLEPTGVGHDAKLMQKRENAKKSLAEVAEVYKNTTETKGFLSDLCNALRLTRGLTGSGYGSFATPDGKVFTIRVSNHNVNTSRIGDEPMESIVIKTKRQPNRFKPQAGKTANEYVYFKEDIRNAPAGTLSKIAESISELLYTGEYQDKTGLAKHNPSPEIASDDDVMFRDGDDKDYEKAHARDIYERRVASGMYQMQEALQDSMLGLKETMLDIVQAETGKRGHIEDIAGFENAYLGENRLSSTNLAEASEFNRRLWKPLLQEVARLAKTADERAELTDYMMAKHGLERNEVMAERFTQQVMNKAKASVAAMIVDAYNTKNKILAGNDQKAINAYNRKIAAIKAKFVAGNTLTDDEYVKLAADSFGVVADIKAAARTEAEAYVDANHDKYYKTQRKDYAGLTALTEESDVAKAEAEARNMVDAYENAHDTAELWARTNAVTGSTLAKSYQCGMIDRSTYNEIKGMYQNYIPLRGFDEKTSEEVYAYLNDRRSAFSAPIKTTKGRKSKADDPFANMESMAESAIAQGNRNVLVKQKFLNFVLAHPSDLVSVSDLWLGYDNVADEWKPLHPGDVANTFKIDVDDTPAEIERKMEIFEAVMEQKALADPAHFVKQKDRPDIPYRVVDTGKEREHQVIVKRNGKDYVLTVNGNPRAAQALNGQTNPDNDANGALGKILHDGEWVNRELSAFYTTRNPDFIASNFMRDALYSNTMAWIKESPGYAWRFNRNFMKVNPAKMKTLFGRLRNGTLDMNDATDKLFYQFYTNGGETGYTVIRDIEELKNDIRRELKMNNGRLPLQKAWMWLGIRFDEYNRAVENCARFAAFVTSRQMRRSLERAVWDAKEISVNFNKKGSGAKFIEAVGETKSGKAASFVSGIGRSFYVFWNAAAQGTWNFGKNVSRNPKKALTGVALLFLLGAINAAVNSDDDEDTKNSYYNLPEYVRRSNIVFRLPWMKEQWISIPLPVEYRSIYGMGELAASAAFNDREHMTGGEVAGAMAAQVSQMLPIDMLEGGGGWRPFVPSAVKPMAEVLANKSWTGMPIYRDGEWNKNDPEWTKAFKSANEQLVGAAEWLNEISGGDKYTEGAIDINPAVVEYLLTGYFGGVANTVNRMVKTGETVMGEREYDPKSFIILNRLVKNGDERTENRALTNEYFRLRDEYEKTRNRLNHYEDDTDDGVFDYADKIAKLNSSPEYRRMEIFEDYGPDIESITQELKEPMPDEDRRELEQERTQLMRELVDEVNKSREKQ